MYIIYLHDNLINRYNYHPCFIDEEIKAQRLSCPSIIDWDDG